MEMTMSRRSYGEGSIYQRPDGLWVAAISLGGKRRVVYGKTRKEAATKLAGLQQTVSAGRLVEATRLTLSDYLADWLETSRPNLRPSTHASYTDLARVHVAPVLGSLRLQSVRPLHLARLYADRQRQGYSNRRVQMVHRLLHKALGDAVRWQMLDHNPAADVTAPRTQQHEQHIWTEEQATRFLQQAHASSRAWDTLWAFLLGSGCRVGEALGLRWGDITWDTATVRISRSVTYVNNRPVEGEPKTKSGRRSLTLPVFALQALRAHQERRATEQSPGATERCFSTTVGTVPQPSNLLRALHGTCRAAGVPELRVHDLRHVHATLAIRHGADLKSLQRRLGHSSLAMTLGLYAHAVSSGDEQTAAALQHALGVQHHEP
jgi:integrase